MIDMSTSLKYIVIYKPYMVLSQFTKEIETHRTLRDVFPELPGDVYPVGRLDRDSEGLLLLTNDNKLKHFILDPESKLSKTYLAQVEGLVTEDAVKQLEEGVTIKVNKKLYHTRPAQVRLLDQEPQLPDRDPPIRYRQAIPTSWLELKIIEGKNRQVRKMCAKVGFPVLRLVRKGIGILNIEQMQPGDLRYVDHHEIKSLIHTDIK